MDIFFSRIHGRDQVGDFSEVRVIASGNIDAQMAVLCLNGMAGICATFYLIFCKSTNPAPNDAVNFLRITVESESCSIDCSSFGSSKGNARPRLWKWTSDLGPEPFTLPTLSSALLL
jgi:hypothetical protein